MLSFKQYIKENLDKLHGSTHSIVDGLNRSAGFMKTGKETITARIISADDVTPLSDEEKSEHEKISSEARRKGDYFTGSTFGGPSGHYSVQQAIEASKNKPVVKIPLSHPFIQQQVKDWWQGDEKRAKKAGESHEPILIMRH